MERSNPIPLESIFSKEIIQGYENIATEFEALELDKVNKCLYCNKEITDKFEEWVNRRTKKKCCTACYKLRRRNNNV